MADGWQPIETAPRDAEVLVYDPDEKTVTTAYWQDDVWFTGWMNWSSRSDGFQLYPTHWMPKPPPPQPAGTDR